MIIVTDTHQRPACVIPGCAHPVPAWGQPCPECRQAFGAHLRPTDTAPLTRDEIAARDTYVERAYHARRHATGAQS